MDKPHYRKILHIDMDAFFAAIEQRDNPHFQGKPLVVGGNNPRSVVAAASYEARTFGIHSAMPMAQAKKRCQALIITPPRFEVYREVSTSIREIFHHYTHLVEPLALDEAFLDVSENYQGLTYGKDVALAIKKEIKNRLSLSASAGVSYNKFLAKLASDIKKPDGLFILHPKNAKKFIARLPIEKFFGVGPATTKKMHALNIFTGKDLARWSEAALVKEFGKVGRRYYLYAKAEDNRPVNPNRIRKSVSVEDTFTVNLMNKHELIRELNSIYHKLLFRCERNHFQGRTLTLKVKYHDFKQITRSKSAPFDLVQQPHFIWPMVLDLLEEIPQQKEIRLLGLTISNHDDEKFALNNELNQRYFDFTSTPHPPFNSER